MFDLTTSAEFMAALEKAVVVAVANAQIITPGIDPENEWLTPREAQTFVRFKEAAFKRFCEREKNDIVTSTSLGETEVRYQLAALQKIMRKKAVGLPEPAAAARKPFPGHGPANGKTPKPDRQFTEPFLIR